MNEEIIKKDKNLRKICFSQFILGSLFLINLTGFIAVLLTIYFSNIKKDMASNFIYIFIIILFGINVIFIIINSIFGLIYAKKIKDKKLMNLFIFSTIFIIPFLSIYSIFASATLMLNIIPAKQRKNKTTKKISSN